MNNDAAFDKNYWEDHWDVGPGAAHELPANPYLAAETAHLPLGSALDAGCGTGAEALALAERGWQVTGADISRAALTAAARRAEDSPNGEGVTWVETDLATWVPGRQWDLVLTNYAHSSISQLAFYRRLAEWVAPRGTVLIVGHLHDPASPSHHPTAATVTLDDITELFDPSEWSIDTARENTREIGAPGAATVTLHDVIVRAHRHTATRTPHQS